MTKKLLSLLLAVCMVLPFALTSVSASSATYYDFFVDEEFEATKGEISFSGPIARENQVIICYVTPEDGYLVDTVTITGKDSGTVIKSTSNYASAGLSFKMPAEDIVATATFKEADGKYATDLYYDEGKGTVDLSQNGANYKDYVYIDVDPDTGYKISTVKVVNDKTNKNVSCAEYDVEGGVYTYKFRMPDASVSIYVTFESKTGSSDDGEYEINIDFNESRGDARTSADYADSRTVVKIFTDPDTGYYVDDVVITSKGSDVDGDVTCMGSADEYFFFIMPEDDVDIYVYFYRGTGSSTSSGKYNVEIEDYDEDYGEIWVNKDSADYYDLVIVNYTVVEGVELDDVFVYDEDGDLVDVSFNNLFYSFRMPRSDVYVEPFFSGAPLYESDGTEYPVSIVYNEDFGDAWTIEDTYEYGKTVRVYVDPINTSEVETVLVRRANGAAVTGVRKSSNGDYYSFKMPSSAVTITVIFSGDDAENSTTSSSTKYFNIEYDCNDDYGDVIIADEAKSGKKVEFAVDGYVHDVRVINLSTGKDITVRDGDYDDEFYFTMPASDVFVDVLFDEDVEGNDYDVDIDDYKTSQGEVDVSTNSADEDDRVKIYVQPKSGYAVDSVKVYKGTKKVTVKYINDYCYYFTMPNDDVEVRVTFEKAVGEYEIDASYTSSQGTVTLSTDNADSGETVEVTVEPKSGYKIKSVTAKKTTSTSSVALTDKGNGSYTFKMPSADVTVSAVFEPIVVEYTITNLSDASFGTATVAAKSEKNKAVTITAMPKSGYAVNTVSVTDAAGKAVTVTKKSATTWSFTMPASNVKVNVTFGAAAHVCPSKAFTDIVTTEWYHDAVDYAVSNGIMNGMSATTFAPSGTVTRAMVTTVLYRIAGEPKSTATLPYTDVPANEWYTEAVRWAAEKGLLTNVSNSTKFEPNATITREQFATMIYRFEQHKAGNTIPKPTDSISKYSDMAKVSTWAVDALNWCGTNKVINGNANGTVDPQGSTTRAQLAQILYNYKDFN